MVVSVNANAFPVPLINRQHLLSVPKPVDLERQRGGTKVLQRGQVRVLKRPGQVKVMRGAVWLTGTPAEGDVILQAGASYRLERSFPFVVEALAEAEVVVSED